MRRTAAPEGNGTLADGEGEGEGEGTPVAPLPGVHAGVGLRAAEASVSRRTVLAMALAGAGLSLVPARHVHAAAPCVVENVTGLYAVEVGRVLRPRSREAVRDAVLQWPGRIADPAFAAR
jgi:hypothetical protein